VHLAFVLFHLHETTVLGEPQLASTVHSVVTFSFGCVAIFLTWLALATTFCGLGLLLLRTLEPLALTTDRVLASFWVGFAAVVSILQLWHFVFPITWRTLLLILMVGGVGLFSNRTGLWIWISELHWDKERKTALLLLIIMGLWMADWATGPCTSFDSGMYHIPAVHWAATYPIIPGIGNLHDRLALNNSGLLYAAMIGTGPWFSESNHLANGLLVFMLIIQVVLGGYRLFSSPYADRSTSAFDLLIIIPAVTLIVTGDISSLSTDVAPAVVLFVTVSKLYHWLILPGRSAGDHAYDFLVLVPLFCLAVCLKATDVVFSSLAFLVTAWLMWREGRSATRRRALWCAGALFLILGISWLMRGVILSGYLLYPSRIGGVPVEWRVPAELAEAEMEWVTVYARHSVQPGLGWVRTWLMVMLQGKNLFRFLFEVLLPTILALASAVYFVRLTWQGSNWRPTARGWLLAIPILAGVVFWFVKLPDPRFGFYLFWMGSSLCVAQLAAALPAQSRVRCNRILALSCVLLASFPIIFQEPSGWIDRRYGFVRGLIHSAVVIPGGQGWLYPIPTAELHEFTTDSGLKLSVPVNDNRCWDAPIPCTPHPAPNLVLKTRFGRPEFLTKGSWEQLNWPNPQSDFLQWFRLNQSHGPAK
jgi:hypothetical protein